MDFSAAIALAQLTRLGVSALVYLALVLPVVRTTGNLAFALTSVLPIATICMSGFAINNLYDIEKDRENHPERPLPSGKLSPTFAGAIYFLLLALSLWLVRSQANSYNIFLYLLLLVASVNYNVAISYFPYLKNLYVASAGLIPLFILSTLLPSHRFEPFALCAVFFYLLSRELFSDIRDAAGDHGTFAKIVGPEAAANTAFGLKLVSSASLLGNPADLIGDTLAFAIIFTDVVCIFLWKKFGNSSAALRIMKLQAVAGMYYLI
jgi:geranylgeranylglycerol-phosphate geranylgeranyltransferase